MSCNTLCSPYLSTDVNLTCVSWQFQFWSVKETPYYISPAHLCSVFAFGVDTARRLHAWIGLAPHEIHHAEGYALNSFRRLCIHLGCSEIILSMKQHRYNVIITVIAYNNMTLEQFISGMNNCKAMYAPSGLSLYQKGIFIFSSMTPRGWSSSGDFLNVCCNSRESSPSVLSVECHSTWIQNSLCHSIVSCKLYSMVIMAW